MDVDKMATITKQPLDEIDHEILGQRLANFIKQGPTPRIGDYVDIGKNVMLRVADVDGATLKLASRDANWERRFYLTCMGSMIYSGTTSKKILLSDVVPTHVFRAGFCWFFHHDIPKETNKIDASVMLRVYKCEPR